MPVALDDVPVETSQEDACCDEIDENDGDLHEAPPSGEIICLHYRIGCFRR